MKTYIILLSMFLFASCTAQSNINRYDAIVSQSNTPLNKSIPRFASIEAALAAAPEHSLTPFRIFIENGTYREKLVIDKNNLQLIGQDARHVHLVFNDYAGKLIAPNKILTTYATATLTLKAVDLRFENLTIENDFNFRDNDALANDDPHRIADAQAVALHIAEPSDRILVRNLILRSNQDTLFVDSGRSWFDKVFIAGNVDFIFGKGTSLFTDSEIKTIARGKPSNPHGFITAPSTNIQSPYGFTFLNCRLTREDSVPDNSVALGRPWHPTTNFPDGRYADPNAVGKAVFIHSWMGPHIYASGWHSMSGTEKGGGKKIFAPQDARFFEYENFGPGALKNNNRQQLSRSQARAYTSNIILGDWRP